MSLAAAKESLQAASYRTGLPQFADRCDRCQFSDAGTRQHGRHCRRHGGPVKTHGHCLEYRRRGDTR